MCRFIQLVLFRSASCLVLIFLVECSLSIGQLAAKSSNPIFCGPDQCNNDVVGATSPTYMGLDDALIHLDYSSLSDEVLRKKTANFVYFNANFQHCRHCHKFFGLWKELATDIRWWRQVIRLLTINCSDEDNIEACRRAGVTQFPQVRYYWIWSNSLKHDGQRIRILGKSVHAMRHIIMDRVYESYVDHNKLISNQTKRKSPEMGLGALTSPLDALPVSQLSSLMMPLLSGASAGGDARGMAINPDLLGSLLGALSNANNTMTTTTTTSMPTALASQASSRTGAGSSPFALSSLGNPRAGALQAPASPVARPETARGSVTAAPIVGAATSALQPIPRGQLRPMSPAQSTQRPQAQTQLQQQQQQQQQSAPINQLMGAFMGSNFVREQLAVAARPMPSNWPELEPIETSNAQQLVELMPLDAARGVGALLIMETQEYLHTGLEVMLDLIPYGNQTYIGRVRDERGLLTKSLTKRDDVRAPALIYVTPTSEVRLVMTAPKYANDEDLRRAFVRAFERRQVKHPVRRVWSGQASSGGGGGLSPHEAPSSDGALVAQSNQEEEELKQRANQVYMNDLTNALRASLMEQVFRHTDLSDDQYNALVRYVYMLINYFPFNNDESLKFMKRLHSWLQNQVSPMDVSEYKKQFHDIDDVIPQREWIACRSLSNTKIISASSTRNGRHNLAFDNPSQLGKMVSNFTRLLRGGGAAGARPTDRRQLVQLAGLFPASVSGEQQQQALARGTTSALVGAPDAPAGQQAGGADTMAAGAPANNAPGAPAKPAGADSPLQRIIKSLTSGSLGSDSSILKIIATALRVGASGGPGGGSKSKFAREYPCGAWKLAHVMVANEFVKDSPRKDVKHLVLHSIYQYMLHFYACSTCGNRVSDVSGEFRLTLDEHLMEQSDSVLLLWKMHNRVNKRLEAEFRPGSLAKIQFPSETLCPKCRISRAPSDVSSTPNWQEKQVLNFLVFHYRAQNIITRANSSSSFAPLSLASLSSGSSAARGPSSWRRRQSLTCQHPAAFGMVIVVLTSGLFVALTPERAFRSTQ